MYALSLGSNVQAADAVGGIYLCKVGPSLLCQDVRFPLAGFGRNKIQVLDALEVSQYYIQIDPSTARPLSSSKFRDRAVHVPFDDVLRLAAVVPETLWDVTDRVFLRPKPYSRVRYPMALAMRFYGILAGRRAGLVVLCDYREYVPSCTVFDPEKRPRETAMIFKGRYGSDSIVWTNLELEAPSILYPSDQVEIEVGDEVFRISVSLVNSFLGSGSTEVEVFSLKFNISSPRRKGFHGLAELKEHKKTKT